MTAAVVTGAGGGLGRAVAIRLASDGHRVAACDVSETDVIATCDQIKEARGTALPYVVDLRDEQAIAETVVRVQDDLGPIAALVNNAAIFPAGSFFDVTTAEYDDVVAVNQRAYFFVAQAVARLMLGSDGGSIVNIGSITQHGGWSDMAVYVTTKGAAAALTRALATELGPSNIRVNCVAPGAFPTAAEEVHPDREGGEQPPGRHHPWPVRQVIPERLRDGLPTSRRCRLELSFSTRFLEWVAAT